MFSCGMPWVDIFKWGWLHSRATITKTWSNPGGHPPPPPPARNQTFTLLSPKHCLVFMSFTNSTLCSNCIDLPVRKQGKHFKYKYISCKTSKCTNLINFCIALWSFERRNAQSKDCKTFPLISPHSHVIILMMAMMMMMMVVVMVTIGGGDYWLFVTGVYFMVRSNFLDDCVSWFWWAFFCNLIISPWKFTSKSVW